MYGCSLANNHGQFHQDFIYVKLLTVNWFLTVNPLNTFGTFGFGFTLWNLQPCRYRIHANLIDA